MQACPPILIDKVVANSTKPRITPRGIQGGLFKLRRERNVVHIMFIYRGYDRLLCSSIVFYGKRFRSKNGRICSKN